MDTDNSVGMARGKGGCRGWVEVDKGEKMGTPVGVKSKNKERNAAPRPLLHRAPSAAFSCTVLFVFPPPGASGSLFSF